VICHRTMSSMDKVTKITAVTASNRGRNGIKKANEVGKQAGRD
jgi:hypothetical protein